MITYDSIIIAVPAIPPNRGLRAFPSATQILFSRLIIDILKLAPEDQLCVQNKRMLADAVFLSLQIYILTAYSKLTRSRFL